jgi:hypothetical protein
LLEFHFDADQRTLSEFFNVFVFLKNKKGKAKAPNCGQEE